MNKLSVNAKKMGRVTSIAKQDFLKQIQTELSLKRCKRQEFCKGRQGQGDYSLSITAGGVTVCHNASQEQ